MRANVQVMQVTIAHLKLEKALQSMLSSTPHEQVTSAVIEPSASPTVHESRNDLSELKVMIAELKQEIKNDIKKEINSMLKTSDRISKKASEKQRWELQELRQDNKDSEKRIYNRFETAFKCMLEKTEEHIQENACKLSTLADLLEDVKQTFTTQIETAENLASTTDRKATAANSECKKLGDRPAALEDGYRRKTIRIECLTENRDSPNPKKNIEFFSKYLSLSFCSSDCTGQTLTQPTSASAQPGQTVSLSCKASGSVSYYLHWYHQKAGQTPKLLISYADTHQSGIPERFSGQYSGTDFTLQISGVQPEDAGYYYCQQSKSWPLTVIKS
ncbi:KV311 protein, partial [Polypterus senegalus]